MRTLYTSALAVTGLLILQAKALGLEKLEGENCDPDNEGPDPNIEISELKFMKRRCNDRQLTKQGGARNLCDDCNSSPIDGTCSWSFPIDDPLKKKSEDAACRCNPHTYFFAREVNPQKCNTERFPGCLEGGTCHKSWPWYDPLKGKSPDAGFRCKYPFDDDSEEDSEEEEEQDSEEDEEDSQEDEEDSEEEQEEDENEDEEESQEGEEDSQEDEKDSEEEQEEDENEDEEESQEEEDQEENEDEEEDNDDQDQDENNSDGDGDEEEENEDPDEDQDDQDEQDEQDEQDDQDQDEADDDEEQDEDDSQPVVDCLEAFDDFNDIQLCAHNQKRAQHIDTDPLELDDDLAAEALEWSKVLAELGQLKHSDWDDRVGQGENLAWHSSSKAPDNWSALSWYDEIKYYDFEDPSWVGDEGKAIGHFTQMVWTDSKKLGCGEYEGYVTCRYSPPGNFNFGTEAVNKVKPLKPGVTI